MPTAVPRVVRYSNGFEVVCAPSRTAPVVAVDVWVKVGSAQERDHEAGLAHLTEHMLFKGTARRGPGELAREIEAVGGEINAYTSPDHTVYSVLLSSRYVRTGLDVLSDALFHSAFAPEELEKEKQVVLEEIRRGRDLPHHALSHALFSEAYGGHPYGKPVIGTEASVSSYTREDCLSFVRRWYVPGNMTLVLGGRTDWGALRAPVEALFAGRASGAGARHHPLPRVPRPAGFRARLDGGTVEDTYFDLAFPGPSALDPRIPAVDVLAALLGQGEASRLQHSVKLDRNLVRSVGAGCYAPNGPGMLYAGGTCDPALLPEAYEAVCEELFRLCHEPVARRELERAKENLEADFVYQRETAQGQAQKAGYFHVVLGDVAGETSYVEAVRATTPDDVRAAARRYFRVERGLLVVLQPAGAVPEFTADAAGELTRRAERRVRPRAAAPRRARGTPETRVCLLAGGARLLVRVNPEVPLVAVRAALLGGSRRETKALAGAFHLLADGFVRGTKTRDVFALADAADGLGGQIEGFSGRNSFGLKAEFLSKYVDDGLELFGDVLCHPLFPEEELAKAKEDVLGALRQRKDHPGSHAFRRFEEALYPTHPLGTDVLGTPRSVARISSSDLAGLHARFARPAHLAVAVTGDVDPDAVEAFFAQALEPLRNNGTLPREPRPPEEPNAPVTTRVVLPVEQAHVVVGFLGTTLTSLDRAALRVANSVLSGQGGRLFRKLRDELGLAYSVGSACIEGLDRGYIAAHVATAPSRAEAARDRLLEEFTRLARGEVARGEVEEAKRKLVGGFELSLQENAFQAAQLALDEVYGLGHRALETYAAEILAVTRAEVIEAAQRYFAIDRHVCSLVEPRAKR